MSSPIPQVGLRQDPARGAFTTASDSIHDIIEAVRTTPLIPSGPYLRDEATRLWHSQCSAEEHADVVGQILAQYEPTAGIHDDATDNVIHFFAGAYVKHLALFEALNEYREDKVLAGLFKLFATTSSKALNLAFNRDRIMWAWKPAILDALRAERELTRELLDWHTPSLEQIFHANESFLYSLRSRERAARMTATDATDRAILYQDLLADFKAEYIDLEPVLPLRAADSPIMKRHRDIESMRQAMLGEFKGFLEIAMLGGRLGEEDLTRRREAARIERARRAARMRPLAARQAARVRARRRRAALGTGPRWRHSLRSGKSWDCAG